MFVAHSEGRKISRLNSEGVRFPYVFPRPRDKRVNPILTGRDPRRVMLLRSLDAGMPEQLGNFLDRDTLPKQPDRECIPQTVGSKLRGFAKGGPEQLPQIVLPVRNARDSLAVARPEEILWVAIQHPQGFAGNILGDRDVT